MPKSLHPHKVRRRADRGQKAAITGLDKRKPGDVKVQLEADDAMEAAAKLYGLGFTRGKIARAMASILCPGSKARTEEQLVATARNKLRRWESYQEFRDMVWKHAVEKLDMQAPLILEGVAGAAKRGRVDAAKLALEVTGRHTSQSGITGPIEIQLSAIPRPDVNERHNEPTQLMDSAEFRSHRERQRAIRPDRRDDDEAE